MTNSFLFQYQIFTQQGIQAALHVVSPSKSLQKFFKRLHFGCCFSFKSTLTFITSSAGITEGFSMCGGDFVEVYSDPSHVGRIIYFLLMFCATNNSWNFRSLKWEDNVIYFVPCQGNFYLCISNLFCRKLDMVSRVNPGRSKQHHFNFLS